VAFNSLGEILAANSISINPELRDLDNKKVQEKVIDYPNSPRKMLDEEIKEKVKEEINTFDLKKKKVESDDTTCDRCNKSVNDCKCFNEKTIKPNELQKAKTDEEQTPEKETDTELTKITGKIDNAPQAGTDTNDNVYYLANFTDQKANTFPIYL